MAGMQATTAAEMLDEGQEAQPGGDAEALRHLHQATAQGTHWFVAVLEAIALWASPEEWYDGRYFRYLVGGEAFDWLLLAERLCEELDEELAPPEQREGLLFFGRFPVDLGPWEFEKIIGRAKYRAHLNYWYGVLVEEALLLEAEERFAKEGATLGTARGNRQQDAGFLWVYGEPQEELLRVFYEERGMNFTGRVSLTDMREFTYWCFKYRLKHRDPAKVASDTRLGLQRMQRMRAGRAARPEVPLG
jgi:hypothetical protein